MRAFFSASANEPPIRPTPMMTSLLMRNLAGMGIPLDLLGRRIRYLTEFPRRRNRAAGYAASARRNASRKRTFSDSSPIVTRRCSGMP